VAAVVTSPLLRARRTADLIAAAVHPADGVVADERLRENDFGDWDGLTFAEVAERWPEELRAWFGNPALAPPGGESVRAVMRRVKAAHKELVERWGGRTVVVVAHVTPVKCLTLLAGALPQEALFRLHLDLCSLTTLEWYADGPSVLRGVNDVGHLEPLPG
jgi:probable phosphoglycerate mutase